MTGTPLTAGGVHAQPPCKTAGQFLLQLNYGIQQSRFRYLVNCFENLLPNSSKDTITHSSTIHNR